MMLSILTAVMNEILGHFKREILLDTLNTKQNYYIVSCSCIYLVHDIFIELSKFL